MRAAINDVNDLRNSTFYMYLSIHFHVKTTAGTPEKRISKYHLLSVLIGFRQFPQLVENFRLLATISSLA